MISQGIVQFESETIRREIINRILYLNQGLRHGLNQDVRNVGADPEDLLSYILSKDKKYQKLEMRARRSAEFASKAYHRRRTIELIVQDLCTDGEIFHLCGIWTLKVSTVDDHRRAGRHPRKDVKYFNDHHFHGRPKRDRKRPPARVS